MPKKNLGKKSLSQFDATPYEIVKITPNQQLEHNRKLTQNRRKENPNKLDGSNNFLSSVLVQFNKLIHWSRAPEVKTTYPLFHLLFSWVLKIMSLNYHQTPCRTKKPQRPSNAWAQGIGLQLSDFPCFHATLHHTSSFKILITVWWNHKKLVTLPQINNLTITETWHKIGGRKNPIYWMPDELACK